MNHATDDGYANAVIETVRDLTRQVEASVVHADEERDKLRQYVEEVVTAVRKDVEDIVTAVRKDVNLTTAKIYIRLSSHDRQHGRDRVVNTICFVTILILLLINLALASYLIGRGT